MKEADEAQAGNNNPKRNYQTSERSLLEDSEGFQQADDQPSRESVAIKSTAVLPGNVGADGDEQGVPFPQSDAAPVSNQHQPPMLHQSQEDKEHVIPDAQSLQPVSGALLTTFLPHHQTISQQPGTMPDQDPGLFQQLLQRGLLLSQQENTGMGNESQTHLLPQDGDIEEDNAAPMQAALPSYGVNQHHRLSAGTSTQMQQQATGPSGGAKKSMYSTLDQLGDNLQVASPSIGIVKHRSKKHATILLSPQHLLHIPRTFLQEHFDVQSVLRNGLYVEIDADGMLDPDVVHTSVANYTNKSGYSYHRLLGFKPVCRRYQNWKVVGWQAISADRVRLCITRPPATPPPQGQGPPDASSTDVAQRDDPGQGGGVGPSSGLMSRQDSGSGAATRPSKMRSRGALKAGQGHVASGSHAHGAYGGPSASNPPQNVGWQSNVVYVEVPQGMNLDDPGLQAVVQQQGMHQEGPGRQIVIQYQSDDGDVAMYGQMNEGQPMMADEQIPVPPEDHQHQQHHVDQGSQQLRPVTWMPTQPRGSMMMGEQAHMHVVQQRQPQPQVSPQPAAPPHDIPRPVVRQGSMQQAHYDMGEAAGSQGRYQLVDPSTLQTMIMRPPGQNTAGHGHIASVQASNTVQVPQGQFYANAQPIQQGEVLSDNNNNNSNSIMHVITRAHSQSFHLQAEEVDYNQRQQQDAQRGGSSSNTPSTRSASPFVPPPNTACIARSTSGALIALVNIGGSVIEFPIIMPAPGQHVSSSGQPATQGALHVPRPSVQNTIHMPSQGGQIMNTGNYQIIDRSTGTVISSRSPHVMQANNPPGTSTGSQSQGSHQQVGQHSSTMPTVTGPGPNNAGMPVPPQQVVYTGTMQPMQIQQMQLVPASGPYMTYHSYQTIAPTGQIQMHSPQQQQVRIIQAPVLVSASAMDGQAAEQHPYDMPVYMTHHNQGGPAQGQSPRRHMQ